MSGRPNFKFRRARAMYILVNSALARFSVITMHKERNNPAE